MTIPLTIQRFQRLHHRPLHMAPHWHGDAQASAKENPTERAQQGDPSTVDERNPANTTWYVYKTL